VIFDLKTRYLPQNPQKKLRKNAQVFKNFSKKKGEHAGSPLQI
jgi:hypothetical protein